MSRYGLAVLRMLALIATTGATLIAPPSARLVALALQGSAGMGAAATKPRRARHAQQSWSISGGVPGVVVPRNRRGGVLFRFYTWSRFTFASFCCKPSAISPSAARIARARRGDSICAVGPPIGVGWKIQKFAFNTTHQQHRGTAHPWHSATSTSSLFFEVSDKGPRGHLVDLDEI